MSEMQSKTLIVSGEARKKMLDFYQGQILDKTPPYAVFQAKVDNKTITLYESGKCLIQGKNIDDEIAIWTNEKDVTEVIKEEKDNINEAVIMFDKYNCIGSDEVGTGDYFGPIVVASAYVKSTQTTRLKLLGVRDSKKLTDKKILEIAPKIIKEISYEIMILDNETFNNSTKLNLNKMKAILHNKVLIKMEDKLSEESINYLVIDQFCEPLVFHRYLKGVTKPQHRLTFITKGETHSIAVAAASLIARYTFIKCLEKMGEELGTEIPKGAGTAVDALAAKILKIYGENKLKKMVKYSYKNTEKIKEIVELSK